MIYSKTILGDIAQTFRGLPIPRDRTSIENEIPYLHYGDVYKKYSYYLDLLQIKKEIIKISRDEKIKDYQYLRTDDIVINLTSENYEDLGKSIYIKNDKDLLVSGMETTIVRITNTEDFYPLFLKYYFDTSYFYNDIMQYIRGMKVFRVNPNDLLRAKLPNISISKQKIIANYIKNLDDKNNLNNKINLNLEELAKTLYKRWFVDFEFPNDDGEPYQSSGGEMVQSELGFIPKGWEVKELSDVALVSSGKRPPIKVEEKTKEFKYPVIGASGVMAYTQEYNIDEKILIIGRVGTHGIVQRITEKVWASDNTLTIKSNVYEFVYQILNQIDYKSLNRGSTQPLITQTDINKTEILVPKSDLLEYFEKVVSSLFEVHKHNLIQNNKLSLTRDELLPKLMNGEIEVPIEG